MAAIDTSYDAKRKTFFNSKNTKQLRKDKFNIRIAYGAGNQVERLIKGVRLRNMSEELDANGNPIYAVYDFIAEDIFESDNTVED